MHAVFCAAAGTGFLFLMTVLGAAAVFCFRHGENPVLARILPGFAAGVMLAASVWSLLDPAIAAAKDMGMIPWLPAAGGLTLGVISLLVSDAAAARLIGGRCTEGSGGRQGFLLQLAMTLHNIPEGMAVGLSFALAAETAFADSGAGAAVLLHGGVSAEHAAFSAAAALALGIGIQNVPEGAAVSLPLRQAGMPAGRAFLRGCLSGIAEPAAGILTVFVMGAVRPVMPWLLSFAAGAMLYVAAEELIPEANGGDVSFVGTVGIMCGFLVMMILDVALG